MSSLLAERLAQGIQQLGLQIDLATQQQLLAYLALLEKWNQAYNLTAIRDKDGMLVKHILDSLMIMPYLQGKSLLDVGTGAGLPGIVVALVRPDIQVTLLDSNSKKVRFLRQVIAELKIPNAQAEHARVEQFQAQVDMVSSRAFATLADMVAGSAHLLQPQGLFLAMKGQYPQEEIAALPATIRLKDALPLKVPFLAEERHLLRLEHNA